MHCRTVHGVADLCHRHITAIGLRSVPAGILPERGLRSVSLHPHLYRLSSLYIVLLSMLWEKDVRAGITSEATGLEWAASTELSCAVHLPVLP